MSQQTFRNLFPGIGAVEIQPQEIGGFEFRNTYGRESAVEKLAQQPVVVVNNGIHLL